MFGSAIFESSQGANMKLKSLAAAAALAASFGASAQTTSVFDLTSGVFADPYTFTLSGLSDLVGDTNSSGITWFGVLLQAPSLSYSALDTNPDDGFSFSNLSAATYSLTFLGAGTGGYGGFYTVTAVPEPETYALMLAGLGIVGFVAARRRAQG
jgi:PEP-CTERM motif